MLNLMCSDRSVIIIGHKPVMMRVNRAHIPIYTPSSTVSIFRFRTLQWDLHALMKFGTWTRNLCRALTFRRAFRLLPQ
jgi:Flp pilus assembly CpaF family ATPase